MYSSSRKGLRVACDDKGILSYNGIKYPCLLENLSISGVLISVRDFPSETIRPGDTCGLYLCSDPKLCPGEYTSKVTRIAPSKIALHFLDIAY